MFCICLGSPSCFVGGDTGVHFSPFTYTHTHTHTHTSYCVHDMSGTLYSGLCSLELEEIV